MPGTDVRPMVSTTICRLPAISMPHSSSGPRLAVKPRAATSLSQGNVGGSPPTPDVDLGDVRVAAHGSDLGVGEQLMPLDAFSSSTECGCARNWARRCTTVTDLAIGSSINAQSSAESPPPTTTTSCPS